MARHSAVLALILTACGAEPLLDDTSDIPPVVLAPATQAGIVDRRARFREIFCALTADHGAKLPDHQPCEQSLHQLSAEPAPTREPVNLGKARMPLHAIIIPGFGGECFQELGIPFPDAAGHVRRLGYDVTVQLVGGLSSSEANGAQIGDAVLALADVETRPVVLIGHSKGTPDILTALADQPEVAARVAAVVSVAGAVNGTPLAHDAPEFLLKLVPYLPGSACAGDDLGAVSSLQRDSRLNWLAHQSLPATVRYYSVVAYTDREHISSALRGQYDELALLDPRNDGLLLFYDQIVPSSDLLGYLNGDHWAVTLPIARHHPVLGSIFITQNAFPREILLEAILKLVEEDLAPTAGAAID